MSKLDAIDSEFNFVDSIEKYFTDVFLRKKDEITVPYRAKSTIGVNYPTFRDDDLKTGATWLDGKRIDDNLDGLWRIHDELYDFSDFIDVHPGGSDWLENTKGTDITEAFEVHHISLAPLKMLDKYRVRSATGPRNSPFTFHEDGFYRTLKRNVRPLLDTVPRHVEFLSKLYADLLLISALCLAMATVRYQNHLLGAATSICIALCVVSGHNFYHQRNNFRMYYFDLSMGSAKEWRVIHILSHHLYTNTVQDMEITVFEPHFYYLPHKKFLSGYWAWLSMTSVFMIGFISVFIRRWVMVYKCNKGLNKLTFSNFIPLIIPVSMYMFSYVFGTVSLANVLYWWFYVVSICNIYYGILAATAAHHLPEIFHDGDAARPPDDRDWGVHQLDTVCDRTDIKGNHFLSLTNFGEHVLHHLLPTLDHGKLKYLEPAIEKTCEEFGIELRKTSFYALIKGQFMQLLNEKPNPVPPSYKKTKTH